MTKIYYSYQHTDKPYVSKLSKALEEKGYTSFIDDTHIKVGQDWRKVLLQALKNSDGVIVVISEKSLQSKYVISEIGAARAYVAESFDKKFLIPLIYGDIEIPNFIEDLYCIRVNDDNIDETVIQIDRSIKNFTSVKVIKEEHETSKRIIIETEVGEYINDATILLKKRIWQNSAIAYACYILALAFLISGIVVAIQGITSLDKLQTLLQENEKHATGIYTILIFKSIVILALLIAGCKYLFTLGKSFMHESLRNADRRHAISFGEFFIKAYGDKIDTITDVKEIFADWNIDKSSSFSNLDTNSFDPKLTEHLMDIIKNLKSTK